MKDFRALEVWQRAHQITLCMYRITAHFPKQETYGLSSQIRRCSASIAANIAEGCGRRGNPEFHRFLMISSGSASELDYHLLLARDLGFVDEQTYDQVADDLGRLRRKLSALISKVESEMPKAKGQLPTANCQMPC